MEVITAESEQEILRRIKDTDAMWMAVNKENNDRYDYFRSFVYDSSLSDQDKISLETLNRPTLEAPLLPAYLDRQLGEFAGQEFGFSCMFYGQKSRSFLPEQNSFQQPTNPQMMQMQKAENIDTGEMIATHLTYYFSAASSRDLQYRVMQKCMSGGFGVIKCEVEYEHVFSMTPKIRFFDTHDPTMCFFDPNSREVDKSDGNICGEKFLMTVKDFRLKYPHVDISAIDFDPSTSDTNWAFKTNDNNVLVVCKAYEKIKIPIDIVKISTGDVIPKSVYEKIKDNTGIYMVEKPRRTHFTRVVEYICIDNQIIEAKETDFPGLPYRMVIGNGTYIKKENASVLREMTIPFGYYARDLQRLQNYTLNSVANEIENVMQHKLLVAQEALPTQDEWLQPYHNYQQQSIIVYKSRYEDNQEPISNPVSAVPRTGAPPEVFETYASTAGMIQKVLGTFDAALGANAQQNISGKAIFQGALNSNMSAGPYTHGLAMGLESCAQLYADMLPKFIHHYEHLPVITKYGKESKITMNADMYDRFKYYPGQVKVEIKVGPSYQVQKQMAVMMVAQLTQMVPQLQQFFSTEGLDYILDNLDGRNIDSLKMKIEGWLQQQQQVQKQAQQQQLQMSQQQLQNNPEAIKKEIAAQRTTLDQHRLMFDIEKSKQEKELEIHKMDIEKLKIGLQHQAEILKIKDESQFENKKLQIELMKALDESSHKTHDRVLEVTKLHSDQIKHHMTEENKKKESNHVPQS